MKREQKIKREKEILLGTILFSLILFLSANVYAAAFNNQQGQFSSPDITSYYNNIGFDYNEVWANFNNPDLCEASQDFVVNLRPGSCMPAVVRSDLLEEQNVPVFCKMDALKINPLISTQSIKRVSIKTNNQSTMIAGASYHPSQAAIGASGIAVDNPLLTDVGYVVVSLKKTVAEKDMPDMVTANLTVVIEYDSENTFGTGNGIYYLPNIDQSDWNSQYINYGFWKGKGYLRLESVDENEARISIYSDKNTVYKSIVVKKGATSSVIYLPGFYCQAGLKLSYVGQELPKTRALLEINGVNTWVVQKEATTEGCNINNIDKANEKVTITCRGKTKTLSLNANSIYINSKKQVVGDLLDSGKKDYLVYYGNSGVLSGSSSSMEFVVVVSGVDVKYTEDGKIKQTILDGIQKAVDAKLNTGLTKDNYISAVKDAVKGKLGISVGNVYVEQKGDITPSSSYTFNSIDVIEKINTDSNIENYFTTTKETAETIVSDYSNEKIPEGDVNYGDYYGAKALYELATTALMIGKQKTYQTLLDEIIQKFPDSKMAEQADYDKKTASGYDLSSATGIFDIDGKNFVITLKDIEQPTKTEASASFDIYQTKNNQVTPLSSQIDKAVDEKIYEDGSLVVKLTEVQKDRVTLSYQTATTSTKGVKTWTVWNEITILETNDKPKEIANGISIKLTNINAEYLAKINLVSENKNKKSESNMVVQIGIEKRAIQLSPATTKERILNLNKSIEKLEKATESLGSLVKTWKAACYSTSLYLNIKNMLSNSDGTATARQKVMQGDSGWTKKCGELMKTESTKYPTIDVCLAKNAEQINKDVESVTTILNNLNTDIEAAQKGATTDKEIATNYADKYFKTFVTQNSKLTFTNSAKEQKSISDVFGVDGGNIIAMIEAGTLNIQDMRDIVYSSKLSTTTNSADSVLSSLGTAKLQETMLPLYTIEQNRKAQELIKTSATVLQTASYPALQSKDKTISVSIPILELKQTTNTVPTGKYVTISLSSINYIVPVSSSDDKNYRYSDGNIYTKDTNNNVSQVNKDESIYTKIKDYTFNAITAKSCQNNYEILAGQYKIGVYDTGTPKVVPFDLKSGWYIATKPDTFSLGSSTKTSTTSAGMISTFYLCNVGENKQEDFISSDDICTRIDMNSNQPLDEFPCVSNKAEATTIIKKGIQTFEKVMAEYKKGSKGITIDNKYFLFERAVSTSGVRCQDFMSPGDCTLLFNVCDPVLCPSSRCNLGGKYQVDDVIQSGIFGSLVLCLPNAGKPSEGGVLVPICLSGVQAGMDAWVSVMKAHRDCLQENLNTGAMTGICDEMYSVYLCDFFWKQAAPFLRIGIPKLIGSIMGKNQGGGEYLTVQDSWKNMENSFNYFTNVYGVNAFAAFNKRSTGNIGTEVCKSFVSANYPSSADTLDQLLEPDSPVQFLATFDETTFSDATATPTSQYKVYYHIYAGKDSGSYYSVYLKATSASTSFFNLQDSLLVKTGYVEKGATATETKDFTAPTGYKEVCVRINDKEECGFGKVTTEYTINYLTEQYASSVANDTSISSEEECISGSGVFNSLANLNIQSGISSYLSSDISKLGITRICSTGEPGGITYTNSGGSATTSKWVQVGYCDKSNNMICWVDTNSVKNVIKNTDLENATLSTLKENQEAIIQALSKEVGVWTTTEEQTAFEDVKKAKPTSGEVPSTDYLNKIKTFLQNSNNDYLKANLLYDKFGVYNELTKKVFGDTKSATTTTTITTTDTSVSSSNEGEACASSDSGATDTGTCKTTCEGDIIYNTGCGDLLCCKDVTDTTNNIATDTTTTGDPTLTSITNSDGNLVLYSDGADAGLYISPSGDIYLSTLLTDPLVGGVDNDLQLQTSPQLESYLVKKKIKKTALQEFMDKNGGSFFMTSCLSEDTSSEASSNLVGKVTSSNNLCPAKNFCQKCGQGCGNGNGISNIYKKRYIQYRSNFETYSQKNLPNGFDEKSFRALLAAIAKTESGLGWQIDNKQSTPSKTVFINNDRKFTGYIGSLGVNAQLEGTSSVLKEAFENNNKNYQSCYSKVGDSKIKCILAVYNLGEGGKDQLKAQIYASKVLSNYNDFYSYLC